MARSSTPRNSVWGMVLAAVLIPLSPAIPAPWEVAELDAPGMSPPGPGFTHTQALAAHWAPIVYHDLSGDYRDDYLTRFDFDGDWDATNNQASLNSMLFPLTAYVYYSVIESETHYFITYTFFHPYDSSILAPGLEPQCLLHENDMEGVILTIRKDGTPFGTFRVAASQAHGEIYYFKPVGSDVTIGSAYHDPSTGDGFGPDSTAYFPDSGNAVAVFIEADGHGVGGPYQAMIRSDPGTVVLGGVSYNFLGGDGITYVHGGQAKTPVGLPIESVAYELIPLQELWDRRHNENGEEPYCTYVNYVGVRGCRLDNLGHSFKGSCWPINACAANPPWGWVSDAAGTTTGDWFLDPAHITGFYHLADLPERTLPGFAHYVDNPFLRGDKFVDVSGPTGETEWAAGNQEWITWNYSNSGQGPILDGSVRIELSRNGGPWEALTGSTPLADQEFLWTVSGPAADSCHVRVVGGTDCVLDVSGLSGAFSIRSAIGIPGETGGFPRPTFVTPNPFHSRISIHFTLEHPELVELTVHDTRGRLVRRLAGGSMMGPGRYSIPWDSRDSQGQEAIPGMYLYRLSAGEHVQSGKLILVR